MERPGKLHLETNRAIGLRRPSTRGALRCWLGQDSAGKYRSLSLFRNELQGWPGDNSRRANISEFNRGARVRVACDVEEIWLHTPGRFEAHQLETGTESRS